MPLRLEESITVISGIKDKKAALYKKLGISTVRELLFHFPRSYIDMTHVMPLSECEIGRPCLVRATIVQKHSEQRIRKGLSLFKVKACDENGDSLLITFFNNRFAAQSLKEEEEYLLYGNMGGTLLKREISSPMIISKDICGGLMPVYPATSGLSSRVVAADIKRAIAALTETIPETLWAKLLQKSGLVPLDEAVRLIHAPKSWEDCLKARRRVAFDELFIYSVAMLRLRKGKKASRAAALFDVELTDFYDALSFLPTDGQKNAIADIIADMTSGKAMNRLIQGDVGSGKTLVAAAVSYLAHKNGMQTAFMAPTELLAAQHYNTLSRQLGPLGVKVLLVTGAQKAAERRENARQISSGECSVVVGTHALLYEKEGFHSLGLVITDEQHRFGVAQRAALAEKGKNVHTLVMSATPIPRTLSLIIYGDLDVSLIKELPSGRKPVATYRINSAKRKRAFGFIKKHLDAGAQGYIVCPLVSHTDDDEGGSTASLHAASEYAKELAEGEFLGYSVGLLHGKLRNAEKDKAMAAFASGKTQLLVCTTVVEVGVDVPNAAVMMIEDADRFGLSQLHQLRGRVGRGERASSCILVTDSKSEQTAQRLKVMAETNDGFKIAEEDLRLRGPGDLLGARQHGLFGLENSAMSADSELFITAQQAARQLLEEDSELKRSESYPVLKAVERLCKTVGENPN